MSSGIIESKGRLEEVEDFSHIKRWQVSGQSQKDYCIEHRLLLSSFKRQLFIFRQGEIIKACSLPRTDIDKPRKKEVAHFVPVKVTPALRVDSYEISFPSGVVIKVPLSESLVLVVKSLESYL